MTILPTGDQPTDRITLRDGHLAGNYWPGRADPTFAVVWLHGFGSHRGGDKAAAVRDECARRGWAFAAFDFRGHGDSSGTMHELRASRLVDDLRAISRFLLQRGHARLGLIGSSMGGFAAAWFAALHPDAVLGSVLLAPGFGFVSHRWNRLTAAEREEWQRTDRLRIRNDWVDLELGYGFISEIDQFRPEALAASVRTPTLIYHGLADEVVPDEVSLEFLRRATYPRIELRLLKSGDHRLTAFKDEIAAAASAFFAGLMHRQARADE
jgi:pimeloyl-ACP methyl ester carboxylesterase